MATTDKPDLKQTHSRLREDMNYFLEVVARAQAAGAAVVQIDIATVGKIAADLTTSTMDLEAYIS